MLGDVPHSQIWSGGPLGRNHGKRSGQDDPQAPPPRRFKFLPFGMIWPAGGPPVTGSSDRKSPGPPKICRFLVKNMSTPAKNMSIPVKNMSAPAKNMSTPAKNMSIPVKNMSIPAKNMSIPAKHMSSVKKNVGCVDGFFGRRRIFGNRRIFGRSTDFWVVDGFFAGRRIFW